MKRLLLFLFFTIPFTVLNAQTNVSGGIYTNTSWTLANSPYIVVDTVVVFPGVTLTIDPGVMVKFDDGLFIEIRNATLIAVGNVTDSIVFTSNSLTPAAGIWGGAYGGLWINGNSPASAFNFCRIEYANIGLYSYLISYIRNSVFMNNVTGIYNLLVPVDSCIFKFNTGAIHELHATMNACILSNNTAAIGELYGSVLNNCILDSNGTVTDDMEGTTILNSSISYNQNGVRTHVGSGTLIKYCVINYNVNYGITFEPGDTVTQCEIKYNGTGVNLAGHVFYGGHQVSYCDIAYNAIGIHVSSNFDIDATVTKCDISNNDIGIKITNTNVNVNCNRICNNSSYGLQMNTPAPFNVSNNYWCTTDSASTAAVIYDGYDNVTYGLVTFLPDDTVLCYAPAATVELPVHPVTIFPNPTPGKFLIGNLTSGTNVVQILNPLGELVYSKELMRKDEQIIDPHLLPGIYFVRVSNETGISTSKLVVE